MLDSQQTEEAILSRCQSVLSRFYDTEVPDNIPTPNYPYGVVVFGEGFPTARGKGICNPANDTLRATVRVIVKSTTSASLKPLVANLKKALVGWAPPDSGLIELGGGMGYTSASTTTKPTEYVRELYFTYLTNMKGQ